MATVDERPKLFFDIHNKKRADHNSPYAHCENDDDDDDEVSCSARKFPIRALKVCASKPVEVRRIRKLSALRSLSKYDVPAKSGYRSCATCPRLSAAEPTKRKRTVEEEIRSVESAVPDENNNANDKSCLVNAMPDTTDEPDAAAAGNFNVLEQLFPVLLDSSEDDDHVGVHYNPEPDPERAKGTSEDVRTPASKPS